VQINYFQFSCTGDSAALTMRVPICAPSAPNTIAAAIDTPSQMPPAAMIGTSTCDAINGNNTIVDAPVGALNPPPSLPSTPRPSTPASTALHAPRSEGTTWNTVMPLSLSAAVYFIGLPAEVVTNVTPCSATKSTMDSSRTKSCAMFTPNGLSVRSRILAISPRMTSSSPDDVSMMPMAPAFDTAEASCALAIQPMGACTIGMSTPSSSVTRLANTA